MVCVSVKILIKGYQLPPVIADCSCFARGHCQPWNTLTVPDYICAGFLCSVTYWEADCLTIRRTQYNFISNVSFHYANQTPVKATLILTSFKHSQGESGTVFLKRNKCKNTCPVRLLYKYISRSKHSVGTWLRFHCGYHVKDQFLCPFYGIV